jgi:hypothetical protein
MCDRGVSMDCAYVRGSGVELFDPSNDSGGQLLLVTTHERPPENRTEERNQNRQLRHPVVSCQLLACSPRTKHILGLL